MFEAWMGCSYEGRRRHVQDGGEEDVGVSLLDLYIYGAQYFLFRWSAMVNSRVFLLKSFAMQKERNSYVVAPILFHVI